MVKKGLFFVFVTMVCVLPVFSEQITKIAVVDMNKVLAVYYDDAYIVKEIEKRKKEYQDEIVKQDAEIKKLEEKKRDAEKKGDEARALDLENQIMKKKDYLKEYISVKEEQLNSLSNRANQQLTVAEDIINAIKFVSESNGYSIVLNSADPFLVWWNFEVDITDEVLQFLLKDRK